MAAPLYIVVLALALVSWLRPRSITVSSRLRHISDVGPCRPIGDTKWVRGASVVLVPVPWRRGTSAFVASIVDIIVVKLQLLLSALLAPDTDYGRKAKYIYII